MRIIFVAISFFSIMLFSCGRNNNTNQSSFQEQNRPKTEQELKQELASRECARSRELITGKMTITPVYKNAFSMKVKAIKLKCTLSSKATITTFKDIEAKATFKSKTGATVLTKTFNVYEFIPARGNVEYRTEFSVTNQQYKDIADYSWTIVEAKCH